MIPKKLFYTLWVICIFCWIILLGYPVGYYVLNSTSSNLISKNINYQKSFKGTAVYFINLDRSKDRYNRIMPQILNLHLPFHKITAVDGNSLSEKEIQEKVDFENFDIYAPTYPVLTTPDRGTIGCYLSHMKAWQTFLESEYEYALILEDDVTLTPKHMLSLVQELTLQIKGWDIVNFDTAGSGFPVSLKNLKQGKLVLYLTEVVNAGAYLITRKSAQKLLEKALPIKMPLDNYFTRGWELDLVFMGVEPRPVTQNKHVPGYISIIAGMSDQYSFSKTSQDFLFHFKKYLFSKQSFLIRFFSNLKFYISYKVNQLYVELKIK